MSGFALFLVIVIGLVSCAAVGFWAGIGWGIHWSRTKFGRKVNADLDEIVKKERAKQRSRL